MCDRSLYSQCETTQNHEHGTGASFFGYSKLYGQVPGGQAEYLRVPFADFLPVKVPHEHADDRFLFLSDVLPTAWQGLQYADVPDGGTLLVLGAGPIGDMAARMGVRAGHRVISVDRVPERLARVEAFGAEPLNLDDAEEVGSVGDVVREATGGRGPDAVIDAVGMEAHGSRGAQVVQKMAGLLPDAISEPMMKKAGLDRLAALYTAIDAVRRGGTISISGVYGGAGRPDADDAALRQADPGPDGPGQRARAGPTSCSPCWSRTTRSASTPSPPTTSRSPRRPTPTSTSRRRRRAWSRWSSSPEPRPD